jgi:hypothetical protein
VTYPTARTDLRNFERAGILTPLPDAAQISYFCRPIMDAIYTD